MTFAVAANVEVLGGDDGWALHFEIEKDEITTLFRVSQPEIATRAEWAELAKGVEKARVPLSYTRGMSSDIRIADGQALLSVEAGGIAHWVRCPKGPFCEALAGALADADAKELMFADANTSVDDGPGELICEEEMPSAAELANDANAVELTEEAEEDFADAAGTSDKGGAADLVEWVQFQLGGGVEEDELTGADAALVGGWDEDPSCDAGVALEELSSDETETAATVHIPITVE